MASGTKRRSTNELALFPVQFPSGTVVPFAGSTAPEGWALCDGSTVSRSTYAALFAAIGEAWGNGDGSTTFHLPDMRGLFLRGKNNGRSDGNENPDGDLGLGTYQADEIKSHGHAFPWGSNPGSTGKIGGTFQHNGTIPFPNPNQVAVSGGNESRPKNVTVNYIIKL